ncbi:MAG: DUF2970 domain-containing protein [Candidatus Protistobacter heckmanni]|nr:DUF2970 domain-containing protein [Candidatus Protistobacter heckmanni]
MAERKAGFGQTLDAVLWSFFGVRRSDAHERDMQSLNPLHVVVVGVLAAACFVALLIFVVHTVVTK